MFEQCLSRQLLHRLPFLLKTPSPPSLLLHTPSLSWFCVSTETPSGLVNRNEVLERKVRAELKVQGLECLAKTQEADRGCKRRVFFFFIGKISSLEELGAVIKN